jgi:hypothetical protein
MGQHEFSVLADEQEREPFMPTPELCDHAYDVLLNDALPYLVAPPGTGVAGVTLRGVTRADERYARIAVTADPAMASGVAAEIDLYDLADDGMRGSGIAVAAMMDAAAALLRSDEQQMGRTDSHGNHVVSLPARDRPAPAPVVSARLALFGLFSQLTRGGDPPWFGDVYTFTGFMFQPEQHCRIYIRAGQTDTRYGLNIPLVKSNGHPIYGVGASLVQELFSKTREGQLKYEAHLHTADDYCDELLDLTRWVDPPMPRFIPPAPPGTEFPPFHAS